jgi:hypothetical protein
MEFITEDPLEKTFLPDKQNEIKACALLTS